MLGGRKQEATVFDGANVHRFSAGMRKHFRQTSLYRLCCTVVSGFNVDAAADTSPLVIGPANASGTAHRRRHPGSGEPRALRSVNEHRPQFEVGTGLSPGGVRPAPQRA